MRYLLPFFGALLFIAHLSAQKYMFAYDSDKYVNMRRNPDKNSQIIDTVFNLQIIRTGKPAKGWAPVLDGAENICGYIHNSRLVEIPGKYKDKLDSLYAGRIDWSSPVFVAAVDCPEIVTIFSYYSQGGITIDKDTDGRISCISTYPDDVWILDIRTGKLLEDRSAISPFTNVSFCDGRLVFRDARFEYSFYRNRKGLLCRGLIPLQSYKGKSLTQQELNNILQTAEKAVNAGKADKNRPSEGIRQFIGTNDFKFLDQLRQAMYDGNELAREYYPYIMNNFPIDGEGTHAIETYIYEYWGFENKGEIILD